MEVRPGYKQTEVGVIPEEWDVQPLGELVPIMRATASTPRAVHDSDGVLSDIRITCHGENWSTSTTSPLVEPSQFTMSGN